MLRLQPEIEDGVHRLVASIACAATLAGAACGETAQPPYAQVLVLRGSPYDRGFRHGQQLAGRIRSLYSTLLTSSLMPYLNRERPDVASVLVRYRNAEDGAPDSYLQQWQDACRSGCTIDCDERCGFSYLVMLESAIALMPSIPQVYLDEMQGIADGAGLPFEKILVLNTFYDTLLAFRSITYYIRQVQAPTLEAVRFPGAAGDGADNDGDGTVDEPGEGDLAPFEPLPHASLVEIPPDSAVVIDLHDTKLGIGVDKGDTPGVDPDTVRVRLDDVTYESPRDRGIVDVEAVPDDPQSLRVVFRPPGGFRPSAVQSLTIQAGDFNRIVNPPPVHARFMREERVVFATRGEGRPREAIPNEGVADGRTQPTAVAFAARAAATTDGQPFLAQHYALVDSNTLHKHTAVFVHVPDDGIPHAVLGYAGLVWGFAGMNARGLAWTFTHSDTLDNPMVDRFVRELFDARLVSAGVPIGIVGRDLLARQGTVDEASAVLRRVRSTFGWNVLMADAAGGLAGVEMDANLMGEADQGKYVFGPDAFVTDGDAPPAVGGSTGPDDLRIAGHFVRNVEDLRTKVLVFDLRPQRFWTSFYYRSVRTHALAGAEIRRRAGSLDADAAVEILRTPALVDTRDSMMASVLLPGLRQIRYAMGTVPATDAGFVALDLDALWTPGGTE